MFTFKPAQQYDTNFIIDFYNNNIEPDVENTFVQTLIHDQMLWYLTNPYIVVIIVSWLDKIIGILLFNKINSNETNIFYLQYMCVDNKINCQDVKLKILQQFELFMNISVVYISNTIIKTDQLKLVDTMHEYLIPVNHIKLYRIKLVDNIAEIKYIHNTLHLMKIKDIDNVLSGLIESYGSNYVVKFNWDFINTMMLPVKNIVYTFVNKTNDIVTDFICFSVKHMLHIESNQNIVTANLEFYYNNQLKLDEIIHMSILKLLKYGIDIVTIRKSKRNQNICDTCTHESPCTYNWYVQNDHNIDIIY